MSVMDGAFDRAEGGLNTGWRDGPGELWPGCGIEHLSVAENAGTTLSAGRRSAARWDERLRWDRPVTASARAGHRKLLTIKSKRDMR